MERGDYPCRGGNAPPAYVCLLRNVTGRAPIGHPYKGVPYRSVVLRQPHARCFFDQTTPWAYMASATFRKPAMFAPASKLPSKPYSFAALSMLW